VFTTIAQARHEHGLGSLMGWIDELFVHICSVTIFITFGWQSGEY